MEVPVPDDDDEDGSLHVMANQSAHADESEYVTGGEESEGSFQGASGPGGSPGAEEEHHHLYVGTEHEDSSSSTRAGREKPARV